MGVVSAHRTHNRNSTFVPNLGAELGQVVVLQHVTSHAPRIQHITVNWCATCCRSSEPQFGPPQLQIWSQLIHGSSRLRSIGFMSCHECSALRSLCPLGALGRRCQCPCGSSSIESHSGQPTVCGGRRQRSISLPAAPKHCFCTPCQAPDKMLHTCAMIREPYRCCDSGPGPES